MSSNSEEGAPPAPTEKTKETDFIAFVVKERSAAEIERWATSKHLQLKKGKAAAEIKGALNYNYGAAATIFGDFFEDATAITEDNVIAELESKSKRFYRHSVICSKSASHQLNTRHVGSDIANFKALKFPEIPDNLSDKQVLLIGGESGIGKTVAAITCGCKGDTAAFTVVVYTTGLADLETILSASIDAVSAIFDVPDWGELDASGLETWGVTRKDWGSITTAAAKSTAKFKAVREARNKAFNDALREQVRTLLGPDVSKVLQGYGGTRPIQLKIVVDEVAGSPAVVRALCCAPETIRGTLGFRDEANVSVFFVGCGTGVGTESISGGSIADTFVMCRLGPDMTVWERVKGSRESLGLEAAGKHRVGRAMAENRRLAQLLGTAADTLSRGATASDIVKDAANAYQLRNGLLSIPLREFPALLAGVLRVATSTDRTAAACNVHLARRVTISNDSYQVTVDDICSRYGLLTDAAKWVSKRGRESVIVFPTGAPQFRLSSAMIGLLQTLAGVSEPESQSGIGFEAATAAMVELAVVGHDGKSLGDLVRFLAGEPKPDAVNTMTPDQLENVMNSPIIANATCRLKAADVEQAAEEVKEAFTSITDTAVAPGIAAAHAAAQEAADHLVKSINATADDTCSRARDAIGAYGVLLLKALPPGRNAAAEMETAAEIAAFLTAANNAALAIALDTVISTNATERRQHLRGISEEFPLAKVWPPGETKSWVAISPPSLPSADIIAHIPGHVTIAIQCKDVNTARLDADVVKAEFAKMGTNVKEAASGAQVGAQPTLCTLNIHNEYLVQLLSLGAPVITMFVSAQEMTKVARCGLSYADLSTVAAPSTIVISGVAPSAKPNAANAAVVSRDQLLIYSKDSSPVSILSAFSLNGGPLPSEPPPLI